MCGCSAHTIPSKFWSHCLQSGPSPGLEAVLDALAERGVFPFADADEALCKPRSVGGLHLARATLSLPCFVDSRIERPFHMNLYQYTSPRL